MTSPILHRQTTDSRAHPSDRATRPTDQAPAGLGDTASAPCAALPGDKVDASDVTAVSAGCIQQLADALQPFAQFIRDGGVEGWGNMQFPPNVKDFINLGDIRRAAEAYAKIGGGQ